jgi:hypothetical protein
VQTKVLQSGFVDVMSASEGSVAAVEAVIFYCGRIGAANTHDTVRAGIEPFAAAIIHLPDMHVC